MRYLLPCPGFCVALIAGARTWCEVGRRAVLPGLLVPAVAHAEALSDGFSYETLVPGTNGTSQRDGPARKYAKVWLTFVGHVGSFDGPVFDSSMLRAARRPVKKDYVEIEADMDPSFAPGMWEALRLMKVGEKGRFVQPPTLSFGEGTVAFEGDEDAEVKQVPAGATLYYDVATEHKEDHKAELGPAKPESAAEEPAVELSDVALAEMLSRAWQDEAQNARPRVGQQLRAEKLIELGVARLQILCPRGLFSALRNARLLLSASQMVATLAPFMAAWLNRLSVKLSFQPSKLRPE
ncbi:unnamed protein product [Effrenium voratum]|nr:unnamed protein product [Effrenium voratum]